MGLAPPGEALGFRFATIFILFGAFFFFRRIFILISLQRFVRRYPRFLLPRTRVCKHGVCSPATIVTCPGAIAPGGGGDPGGGGRKGGRDPPAPSAAPRAGGCSAGGTGSAAPWLRDDISPGEQSQAPKPNQRVYVPRGGFSLIDGCPVLLPPPSSSSVPDNLQV